MAALVSTRYVGAILEETGYAALAFPIVETAIGGSDQVVAIADGDLVAWADVADVILIGEQRIERSARRIGAVPNRRSAASGPHVERTAASTGVLSSVSRSVPQRS